MAASAQQLRQRLLCMTDVSVDLLFDDVRELINGARARTSVAVNAELTLLYWHIGQRIRIDVLNGERGEYGRHVLARLARKLTIEYGRGWSEQQLRHCMRLAEIYPDEPILSAVRRELSWTQIKTLIYLDAPLKRDFYAELCRLERWSSRQLNERIQSMLFERSALSRNPDDVIRSELSKVKAARQLSPDLVLKDPYILDFLGLSDQFRERDLEDEQIELLELGKCGIHVAEYLTVLPPRATLEAKLSESIARARSRIGIAQDTVESPELDEKREGPTPT